MQSRFPSKINLDQLEPPKIFEIQPDFNRWVRFPLVNGFLRVVVIPKSDIKISLSSRPKDDAGMIVISLGYLDGMRSAIGTIEVPFYVEKTTPNVLKRCYNEFWIFWVNGEIFVLNAGEKKAFISMKYNSYPIHYVGFSSPNNSAVWYLKDGEKIITSASSRFVYHGIRTGYLELAFKGQSDAHFALLFLGGRATPPIVEVKLGVHGNKKSYIRVDNNDHNQVEEFTPNLLSADRFIIFCFYWHDGILTVRRDHSQGPIVIKSNDRSVDFVPHYFAVRTGRGVAGKWIFGVNNAKAIVDDSSASDNTSNEAK